MIFQGGPDPLSPSGSAHDIGDLIVCRVLVSDLHVCLISPIDGNIIFNQIIQQLDTLFIEYTEAIEIWLSFLLIKM